MAVGSVLMLALSIGVMTAVNAQCPSDWKEHGDKCYYLGTNQLSWNAAEDYCQSRGGHLAKDTQDVHSWLSGEVAQMDMSGCDPIYKCNLYIGLLYTPGEGYSWADGSAVDESFMPWQPGEPNNGDVLKSGEIEMRSSDYSNFKWNDRPIGWAPNPNARYICERPVLTCEDDDWKIFGTSCYHFGTDQLSWNEAEDFCNSRRGHLAKDTQDVHSWLSSEVAQLDMSGCSPIYTCNLFIGLLYTPGEGYSWADGTAVDESFMPWQPGEPNNGNVLKSGEIELRSSDYSNFKWNDRPIDWAPNPDARYICERAAVGCPRGWKHHASTCYYFGTNKLTWREAEDRCQNDGGHLAKDTQDVHSWLSMEVSKLDMTNCDPIYKCNLFIGLLFTPGEGYSWADGSAVDESFMPWQPGEPNNGNVLKSGEIELRSSDYSNFKWNDRPIDWAPNPDAWYICEKPAFQ